MPEPSGRNPRRDAIAGRAERVCGVAALLVLVAATSCRSDHGAGPAPSASSGATGASPSPSASAVLAAPRSSASAGDASTPDAGAAHYRTDGCPDGMLRVEGEYCPAVIEECLEEHPEYIARKSDPTVSERCLRYKDPSRCVSKERTHLSFCVDRYEYPNQVGELPRVLTSWTQAKEMCAKEQKRLCTEDEFNFACEGPDMLPYVTGFVRDTKNCNMDKPYVRPDHEHRMLWYDFCLKNDRCAEELKRLDQRHAIGSVDTCIAWSGAVDMNGNVNEWVDLPGKDPPDRSGLKGGWWGPVRSRCRPTVTFHKESDYGYEAGFRCCKDAPGTATPKDAGPG